MDEITKILGELTKTGSLLSAITSGGLIVWTIANIKSIWTQIRLFAENIISFTISNIVEDNEFMQCQNQAAFDEILYEAKDIWNRTVHINLDNDTINSAMVKTLYGFSIKILYGKLCLVNRTYRMTNSKNNVITSIRVFFAFRKNFMKKLDDDIKNRVLKRITTHEDRDYVNVICNSLLFKRKKRSINSVFTNGNKAQSILLDIKHFINSKHIYERFNKPYKYCSCFYGEPGCGKTSAILAIASELNRDIYYINLASLPFNRIAKIISNESIASKSIFVFEDIDAICTSPEKTRKEAVFPVTSPFDSCAEDNYSQIAYQYSLSNDSLTSLSDLLNVTDGLMSCYGAICIFTTNHISKLDPALLRSGRMNSLVKFEHMSGEITTQMIKHYLGTDICDLPDGLCPADVNDMIFNVAIGKATLSELKDKLQLKENEERNNI